MKFKKYFRAGYASYLVYFFLWAAPCGLLLHGFFSPDSFALVFHDKSILAVVSFTLWQALLSAGFSFIMAILPAYYYSRSRSWLSVLLGGTLFIPYFFPSISCVIAFSLLFSSNGIIAHMGFHPTVLYSLKGIILAHAFYNSPIFVKYVGEALRSIPRDLIDDARVSGASRLRSFLKVEFPLIFPACARAFFIVFSFSFTSFAVVLAIGGMSFSTIEVEISSVMRSTLDFPYALSLAIIQFGIISVISFLTGIVKPYQLSGIMHSDRRTGITGFAAFIYLFFEYSIVVIAVIVSFYNFYTGSFDLTALSRLTDHDFTQRFPILLSITNTLFLSSFGAVISVIIAFIMLKNRFHFSQGIVMSTVGISSAFLAIALSYSHIVTGFPKVLFVCAGFICMSIPISYSFMYHHIESFDRTLIEEAKSLGAGRFQLFRYVELPMMLPVLISSVLQIFAILFGEFTIAYTMQLQDSFPILSVTAYSIESARMIRESAAISSLSLILVFGVYVVSHSMMEFSRNRKS